MTVDPTGTWLTESRETRIRVAKCAEALCGTIVWLQEPNDPATGQPKTDKIDRPLIGNAILLDMKSSDSGIWTGQLHMDGNSYSAKITMQSANALKLDACAVGGLICKSQTWSRVN